MTGGKTSMAGLRAGNSSKIRFGWRLAQSNSAIRAGVVIIGIALACAANAQSSGNAARSATANTWNSQTSESGSGSSSQTLTPEQSGAIDTVNAYFNSLKNLQGRFVQIDPDKKKTKGKFYVQKPGKFRFDYSQPSRKIVVSDGKFLAIQDLDLRNEDVYQLDNTPFRILLRNNVDILRDARVLAVIHDPNQVSVTLTEKGPDAAGQITVTVGLQPEPAMTSWATADAQGLQTIVTVSNLSRPEKLKSSLFKREELFRDATSLESSQ